MSRIQQSVEITVKLYKARDAARLLLGAKYQAKMAEYIGLIKMVMADKNVSSVNAAIQLCNATDSPHQQMQILSAAVEMVEPSGVPA